MAATSYDLTTYYAKRIIGDAAAANASSALLQTGVDIDTDIWILNRTNRNSIYGIKYKYDSTDTNDRIEFLGGSSSSVRAYIQLDTGDASFSGTLTVTGAASLNSTLTVNGATSLNNTLTVTDNTTIGSSSNKKYLVVYDKLYINQVVPSSDTYNLYVNGTANITNNSIIQGSLSVTGSDGVSISGGSLSVSGGGIAVTGGNISIIKKNPQVYCKNSDTTCYIMLYSYQDGKHGLYSNGYYGTDTNNPSTPVFHDSARWLIYRDDEGRTTMPNTVVLTNTTDADGTTANAVPLIVGGTQSQQHLEFDSNEIMSKENATTVGNLSLNYNGGNIYLGVNNTSYTVQVRSTKTSTSTATGALTVGGGVGIGGALYVGGDTVLNGTSASQAVVTDANNKIISQDLSVSAPTASGNATSFITSVSQSATGKITASKSTVPTASSSTAGIMTLGASGGAATYGHTHTLSIAADSGTNALTLAASTKYKLTAGGSTYIFTTPPNTTYTFSNKAVTLAWSTTHTIATVGGTNITLKMPANPNTNTWRGYSIKKYTYKYTIAANGNHNITGNEFSVSTPSGYTPVGFTQMDSGTSSCVIWFAHAVSAGTGQCLRIRNVTSSAITNTALVQILYLQT